MEKLKQQLKAADENYYSLLNSSGRVKTNLEQEVREVRSQLETERASRESVEAELAELKQNSAPAIDLSSRAGDIMNFFRTLLPKDTKLPKNTMSKLREILEATED
jgi:uncharacterized protein (DUF3084 family)